MDHIGIAFAGEGQHGVELGPVDVLARSLLGENPVERLPFQLAIDILIECAIDSQQGRFQAMGVA